MEGGDPHPQADDVRLLLQYYQRMTRGPYGVNKALEEAKRADRNSTERIILDASESAWRVYYAAHKGRESQHGFAGQAKLARILDDLSAQPVDCQRDFARQLAKETENEAADGSGHRAKRRRTTVENDTAVSPTMATNSSEAFPIVPERDVYVGAPLTEAKEMFDEQFWDSILRIQSKERPNTLEADVSMVFQKGYARDVFGCQMEIGIATEKVAGLAFGYFGVKVEVKDGVRSLCYPGGTKVEPDPSIKLRGCRRDLSGLFQGDLYEAVRTSPIYQREQQEARSRTEGMSLTISNQGKEGGKLAVFLGQWKASKIKTRLYG